MFKNLSTPALGVAGSQSEIIEAALSHGFRGIDVDILEFCTQIEARGLEYSRRLLASAKLQLGSFPLPVEWRGENDVFQKDLDRLPKIAETARALGCKRAITRVMPTSEERPYHQNFEFHRKRFAEIAAALEPFDVRVGVEFVAPPIHRKEGELEFIHNLGALVTLLGMIGRTNVGVAVDLWHLHVSGEGIEGLRKLPASQIVAVFLSDAPTEMTAETARDEMRLLPGETGAIDSAAALSALAEMGYDGPVTPAAHPSCFTGKRRDPIIRQAGAALEAAWKAAGLTSTANLSAAVGK